MTQTGEGSTETEVWFYHLERQSLETVLPNLLEKTLERGWRAVVQVGSQERLDVIDDKLWTFSDSAFLAHGSPRDGNPEKQPIYLTGDDDNLNGAHVRFLVDGAEVAELKGYERIIFLFDGHDETAVSNARASWKKARDEGCDVTYWQQNSSGRWEKKT